LDKILKKSVELLVESNLEIFVHSNRVKELANSFGIYLGLPFKDIINLRTGALVHDIGKVFIPSDILLKTRILTKEEFAIIKKHPALGHEYISEKEYNNYNDLLFKDIDDIIYQHHERIDGKGYPNKLINNEINFLSKIVSICDSYDAMVSQRVYKNPLTNQYALSQIEKGLGTQFDVYFGKEFISYMNKECLNRNVI
jgi:HD-GYP domain-containing protein (c-di-GMP phosphodiesterase class II)